MYLLSGVLALALVMLDHRDSGMQQLQYKSDLRWKERHAGRSLMRQWESANLLRASPFIESCKVHLWVHKASYALLVKTRQYASPFVRAC